MMRWAITVQIAFELGHCPLVVGERPSVNMRISTIPTGEGLSARKTWLGMQLAVMTQGDATDENCGLTPSSTAMLINGIGMTAFVRKPLCAHEDTMRRAAHWDRTWDEFCYASDEEDKRTTATDCPRL